MADSELALINKVDFKITLANTDAQLENLLRVYLPPLLLKLASPYPKSREKIIEICQHVNTRIKSAPIQLPVEALVAQFRAPQLPADADATMVRTFDLMYIKMGLGKMSAEDKSKLVPIVLKDISTYSTQHSGALFRIFLEVLNFWTPPPVGSKEADNLRKELGFTTDDATTNATAPATTNSDEAFLCEKFMDLMCFNRSAVYKREGCRGYSIDSLPGLSEDDIRFLTNGEPGQFTNESLTEAKINVLKFITSGCGDEAKLFPVLMACHDNNSKISDMAEFIFKRLSIDYEDKKIIDKLIVLYTGGNKENENRYRAKDPVRDVVQVHILKLLTKSKYAANCSSELVYKIIYIGLRSTYSKLKQATIQFIHWVSSVSADDIILSFSSNVLCSLQEWIMSTGWPKSQNTNDLQLTNLRQYAYEAIGSIIKRDISLISDLYYIKFLFESLKSEQVELKNSIQEALSTVIPNLYTLPDGSKRELKALLLKHLSDPHGDQSCKYVSVRYAVRSFAFNDPEARLLCIWGLQKENRSDVIEEAKRGLHPFWFKNVNSNFFDSYANNAEELSKREVEFPTFYEMFTVVNKYAGDDQSFNSYNTPDYSGSAMDLDIPKFAGLPLSVFTSALNFLEQIITMEAVKDKNTVIVVDGEWSNRLEKAIDVDDKVRNLLIEYIDKLSGESYQSFLKFVQTSCKAFIGKNLKNNELISAGTIWFRFLSRSSPSIVYDFLGTGSESIASSLINLSVDPNNEKMELACKALGIILSHELIPTDTLVTFLNDRMSLLETSFDSDRSVGANSVSNFNVHTVEGSVMSLGHVISRLSYRGELSRIEESLIQRSIQYFHKVLTFNGTATSNPPINIRVINAVIEALSQFALFGVLSGGRVDGFIEEILEKLYVRAKADNERAILAFGYLALSVPPNERDAIKTKYIAKIFEISNSKQLEFIFSSGEALTIATVGWQSKVLQRLVDIQQVSTIADVESAAESESLLNYVIADLIKLSKNSKPSLRKFCCIWLLSIVQYCGHLPEIEEKLSQLQLIFMRFLSDRDEILQESSTRGLSIIYEMGNKKLKEDLIHNLVQSFTADSKSTKINAGSVSEDTELFEPGVLNTGEGSVSTYKDILSLASEVGDPSLVYKFMSLASHSALWSSRKGAAFGLGSILSKSNLEEMFDKNPRLLRTLIPKLYRYRFDPITSVQQTMQGIWDTIIPDPSKTINENFEYILEELLKNMGDKEWRVRQASSSGLTDLLQSQPLDLYQDQLERIWKMSFRVMDDIKDSVRTVGVQLTRGLATSLIRHIDVSSGASEKKAEVILSNVVPFLLGNQGLQSEVSEVQQFALATVLKLCQKAGRVLKPFIPDFIEELLGLLSTMEPQTMNYLALNADKYGLSSDKVDISRLASIKASPMMDAIEQLLDQLDEPLMAQTVPKLCHVMRKSVGLPSKIGCSRVLVTLVIRHLQISKPYGDTLLNAAIQQIGDRNEVIGSSYATACGYLCRIASNDTIGKYGHQLQEMFFMSANEKMRLMAGTGINAISKYSPDSFAAFASLFLPVIFVAKSDSDNNIASLFESIWNDNTGGIGAVKLHLTEIVKITSKYLEESTDWNIRQLCAKSIADICNIIGDHIKELTVTWQNFTQSLDNLFKVLLQACKGRSWHGKESILRALISLATKTRSLILDNPSYDQREELLQLINETVLTEANRKKNKSYQLEALSCFGAYLGQFPQPELYDALFSLTKRYLKIKGFKSEGDSDNDNDSDSDSDSETDSDSGSDSHDTKYKRSKTDTAIIKANKLEATHIKVLGALASSFSVYNLYQAELPGTVTVDNGKILALISGALIKLLKYATSHPSSTSWRIKVTVSELASGLISRTYFPGASSNPTTTTATNTSSTTFDRINETNAATMMTAIEMSGQVTVLTQLWTEVMTANLSADNTVNFDKVKLETLKLASTILGAKLLPADLKDDVVKDLHKVLEREVSLIVLAEVKRILKVD